MKPGQPWLLAISFPAGVSRSRSTSGMGLPAHRFIYAHCTLEAVLFLHLHSVSRWEDGFGVVN